HLFAILSTHPSPRRRPTIKNTVATSKRTDTFGNMTTAASNTIAELQSRLSDLELSKTHNDVSGIIQKERTEMLLSLRKIMEAMKTDAAGGASSKELEKLRAENEELKKINAKQNYRIEHLVNNLRGVADK
ncbi:hypothetical protein QTG54_001844, partial [Skeletonema marinoi]